MNTYPRQMVLMEQLYAFADAAKGSESYAAMLAYHTAVDLADQLLKGAPQEGPDRLRQAYEHNQTIADEEEEGAAWGKALQVLEEEMSRPAS